MRHLIAAAIVGLFLAPLTANAGWIIEGSGGKGYQLKPTPGYLDTNLMISGGYGLGEYIRAEVGVVADLGDEVDFTLKFRPMLVIAPPVVPIHARIIVGVANVLGDGDMVIEFGGAVGLSGSLFGVGTFVEAGILPQNVGGTLHWIAEARAGVYYAFD